MPPVPESHAKSYNRIGDKPVSVPVKAVTVTVAVVSVYVEIVGFIEGVDGTV